VPHASSERGGPEATCSTASLFERDDMIARADVRRLIVAAHRQEARVDRYVVTLLHCGMLTRAFLPA
jgi:hypothetical protein